MSTPFWKLGCLYGASAVALGAFGAHGLKSRVKDPAMIANWTTASHFQLFHALALLLTETHASHNVWAKGLFTAGMTMFSGSIYLLVLGRGKMRLMGPVTPLGGLCFIAGWFALAFGGMSNFSAV